MENCKQETQKIHELQQDTTSNEASGEGRAMVEESAYAVDTRMNEAQDLAELQGDHPDRENCGMFTCLNGARKEVIQDDSLMDTSWKEGRDLEKEHHPDTKDSPIFMNGKGKELAEYDNAMDAMNYTLNEGSYVKEEYQPEKEICGICLSGSDNEKGMLDCCNHIFCHECIMTWARKETSCPLCKQRFVTITVMKKSSVSPAIGTPKTSFRLPQRNLSDDPHGIGRNFELAITKPEPKNLNLFIHEGIETYRGESQDFSLKLKLRIELMCGRCGVIFLDQTLDVNVERNVRLPLNDWPWACQECSLECEADEAEVTTADWDFDFDVKGLPHMRISDGSCKNLGLTTLITMSRRAQQ